MPTAAPKVCSKPGCGRLTSSGSRCDRHPFLPRRERTRSDRRYDERRGSAAARGYDQRWRRLRDRKLQANPLCELCFRRGAVEVATEVDHIEPVDRAPERRLDWDNLQSLCHPCHMAKTARDRRNA